MIATSGFLAALECTKFVFGRGSAPDPAEAAYSAPQTPLVTVLLMEREEGMGEERGEGEERRGEGTAPLTQIHGSAPGYKTMSQLAEHHQGLVMSDHTNSIAVVDTARP